MNIFESEQLTPAKAVRAENIPAESAERGVKLKQPLMDTEREKGAAIRKKLTILKEEYETAPTISEIANAPESDEHGAARASREDVLKEMNVLKKELAENKNRIHLIDQNFPDTAELN